MDNNELREAFERMAEGIREAVRAIAEAWEKLHQALAELGEWAAEVEDEEKRQGQEWREAALLAGQRAQARAQAYNRQMQLEKARRAMRRRKRLHDDDGLPDW